jgi:hypothetical protein
MKTKRYESGGLSAAQKEWLGGADQSDPIIMARMRSAVPDAPSKETVEDNDPYGVTKRETSSDLDPYGAASKKPASVERTVVKTKVSPSRDFDTTDTSVSKPKKNAVEDLKKVVSPSSMPKSFKESGGNTTPKKSTASMPSMKFNLPDPLAQFDAKGKRYSGRDTEDRKKGGAIKKMAMGGSASKRADGCAMKGKTRGKMC